MILHVDGDNFFVSCEIARFPHLKGKAVVVGEERGIASALSYEAKRLGVTRAMPVFEIRKKFPEVVVLPSHFELYEQYNSKLFYILEKYSTNVERYSIDECFAYISDDQISSHKTKFGTDLIQSIKKEAEESLGIGLSFGLAPTKTLAKVASKYKKPSGCVTITDDQTREQILKDIPIGQIWGIGRAISASLTSYNILTAYDFTLLTNQFVKKNFGEGTLSTWFELKGIKRYEINQHANDQQKSFQSTRSFGMTIRERSFLLSELSTNTEILCARLRQANLKTDRVSFFIKKNTDYDKYISNEISIGFFTNSESDIYKKIKEAFDSAYISGISTFNSNSSKLLGFKATGVSIHNLRAPEDIQNDLFNTQGINNDLKDAYTGTLDRLKSRFGDSAVFLASSLQSRTKRTLAHNERNSRNKFIYGLPLPYMGEAN